MFDPKCFVDIDGVIGDFQDQALQHLSLKKKDLSFVRGSWDTVPVMCRHAGVTETDFWCSLPIKFWSEMPVCSGANNLIGLCFDRFGAENVFFLSSAANAISAHGKLLWVKKLFPEIYKRGNLILGRSKHACAQPLSFLIDDADHNINNFEKHGGIGILVPRFWNAGYERAAAQELVPVAHIMDEISRSWSIIEARKIILKNINFPVYNKEVSL